MRMLQSLDSGWLNQSHARLVAAGNWGELPLFSELEHPAVQACHTYTPQSASDRFTRHEECTTAAGYLVVEARDKSKGPGWRTAITRHHGTDWAVFAAPHDAFHRTAPQRFAKSRADVEPTQDDIDVRDYKTGEAARTEVLRVWKEELARTTLAAFRDAWAAGSGVHHVSLPEPPTDFLPGGFSAVGATLDFELVHYGTDAGGDDVPIAPAGDAVVEVVLHLGHPLDVNDPISILLMTSVLPVIVNDTSRWSREALYSKPNGELVHQATLSGIEVERILFAAELEGELAEGLPEARPTSFAHYVNGSTIVESVVSGKPMRSACRKWLVSQQNTDGMDICPECVDQLPDISQVKEMLRQRILNP